MAGAEDAAAVLEQFVHDVANLPAEIAHLHEEATYKQREIDECFRIINEKDRELQKHTKQHGDLVPHPQEDAYEAVMYTNFDRADELQAEKAALMRRACELMDRHTKRLDLKIAALQADGAFPTDPNLPSTLRDSPGNLVPTLVSAENHHPNTPADQPPPVPTGGTANMLAAAQARLSNASLNPRGAPSPLSQNAPALPPATSIQIPTTRPAPPGDMASPGPTDPKRRRLNASINIPNPPSSLRQASLGPGTPKSGTPSASRAGSAGPRPAKKAPSRRTPGGIMVSGGGGRASTKKVPKSGIPKKSARRLLSGTRASPSTTGEDSGSGSGSDDGSASGFASAGAREGSTGAVGGRAREDGEGEDEGADDTKYCYCQKVSYGDMVACDNADCAGQWFHWPCAGITAEPPGEWLCRDCAKLPRHRIKKAS
ncbi:hypothetical protein EJ06DRAFT_540839 [Trichodelitschia bisporula]|uniref:Chromatin modification-related protein n=1 Tax=Trichodelitschia bisporula TaxID=703511 RepID=A0A6G1I7Z3_9PEZI|nr:hypothetical protein EJ06DRAFT_540839 [Trichodelitschia bisporula]